MKRTLKEEVRSLERYLGLAPDPRRDRLMEVLEAFDEDTTRCGTGAHAMAAYDDPEHDGHAKGVAH